MTTGNAWYVFDNTFHYNAESSLCKAKVMVGRIKQSVTNQYLSCFRPFMYFVNLKENTKVCMVKNINVV